MYFKSKSYWWEIGDKLKPTHEMKIIPKNTDFVVVGAGYAGLSAALTIARQGKSVVVFDGGMPGFGASTRNGGICSGQIRPSLSYLREKYGTEVANNIIRRAWMQGTILLNFVKKKK